MPVYFWNDPDGSRYRDSYFEMYPGVWRQGDFFRINAQDGCFVLGQSDTTLNRHGVRIGTAEIYRALAQLPEIDDTLIVNLDLPGGQFFMPLFVKLHAGFQLDEALVKKIATHLRAEYTPRHVPDKVYQVPEIPATLTGKKMEVPVRRILDGHAGGEGREPQRHGEPEGDRLVRRVRADAEGLQAGVRWRGRVAVRAEAACTAERAVLQRTTPAFTPRQAPGRLRAHHPGWRS